MAKSFDPQRSPAFLLRRVQQLATYLFTKNADPHGLTQRQVAVLLAADQQDGLSQTALVRATGIDRSTLADMIGRMLKRGWLAKKRTEEDGRENSVRMTAEGRKALKSAVPALRKADKQLLQTLPPKLRSEFLKALDMLAQAANAADAGGRDDGEAKAKARKRR